MSSTNEKGPLFRIGEPAPPWVLRSYQSLPAFKKSEALVDDVDWTLGARASCTVCSSELHACNCQSLAAPRELL